MPRDCARYQSIWMQFAEESLIFPPPCANWLSVTMPWYATRKRTKTCVRSLPVPCRLEGARYGQDRQGWRGAFFLSAILKSPGNCLAFGRPILFVVGSAATLCRRQAQALTSDPDVASVTVSPAVLLSARPQAELPGAGPHADAWQEYNSRLSEALAAGRDAVLLLGDEDGVRLEDGQQLCAALARLVVPQANTVGALVLTGGETARAVLQALQVEGLSLIGELEPGVVASVAQGSSLPVVTKAGAFGDDNTLRRCRIALHNTSGPGEAR